MFALSTYSTLSPIILCMFCLSNNLPKYKEKYSVWLKLFYMMEGHFVMVLEQKILLLDEDSGLLSSVKSEVQGCFFMN